MTEVPAQTLKEIVTKKITPVQHRVFSILRQLKQNGASSFEDVNIISGHDPYFLSQPASVSPNMNFTFPSFW